MTIETVLSIAQLALQVTSMLVLVLLIPALVVGLLVSMFQAATQINEVTLSFIPKLLITLGVLMFAGPWMLTLITDYTRRLVEEIPLVLG